MSQMRYRCAQITKYGSFHIKYELLVKTVYVSLSIQITNHRDFFTNTGNVCVEIRNQFRLNYEKLILKSFSYYTPEDEMQQLLVIFNNSIQPYLKNHLLKHVHDCKTQYTQRCGI